jgi:hypothetical protein
MPALQWVWSPVHLCVGAASVNLRGDDLVEHHQPRTAPALIKADQNQKSQSSGSNSGDQWNVLRGMPKEQANIYRQRAAECAALAKHYENTPLAKYFLELAEQWRQLADQNERSESRVKRMLRLFGYKG